MQDSEIDTLIRDLAKLGRDARRGKTEYTTQLPYRAEDVRNLMDMTTNAMQELLQARRDYLSKLGAIVNVITTNSK